MALRTLELTLLSAKDLRDVNLFSKMDVYAVATISGDHRSQQRTPADRDGGKNPSWNSTLRFPLPSDPPSAARLAIHVLLRSERSLGDRDVGEVHIPIKELLDGVIDGAKFVSYQVRKPGSGKAKGVLNLSYKFLDLPSAPTAAAKPTEPVSAFPSHKDHEPVMAYPAAGASGSAYPPPYPPQQPQAAYGYGAAPPQVGYGYGAAPPQGGYGYGAAPPQGGYGYGAAPPQGGYGYGAAPPQGGYGYGAAPPQGGYGYGAAPPQGGYGYGAVPPQGGYGYGAVPPKKKNNMGLGLGAGLIGGAVGGLLIGDMISDAGGYDAGYDAGFDDGFGF